jgi:hypothetical protein
MSQLKTLQEEMLPIRRRLLREGISTNSCQSSSASGVFERTIFDEGRLARRHQVLDRLVAFQRSAGRKLHQFFTRACGEVGGALAFHQCLQSMDEYTVEFAFDALPKLFDKHLTNCSAGRHLSNWRKFEAARCFHDGFGAFSGYVHDSLNRSINVYQENFKPAAKDGGFFHSIIVSRRLRKR